MASVKSAVLYGPSDVRIEDADIPEAGPGDVLVKVDTALTCGTDVKVFLRGGHPMMIEPPAPFGHEFSGVVAEAGSAVKFFTAGMRVAAANSAPCGECFYCRRSLENLCENLLFINGAYAEYIKIPERIVKKNLLPIPDGLSFPAAALVEPLACVLHGAEEAGVRAGDNAVINGAGPVGLLFIQAMKMSGARVISTETDENRRILAEKSGADAVISPASGDCVKKIMELTDGRGADIAVDATGIPSVWENAVRMVRKGGSVLFFGGCAPGTEVRLDTCLVHYSNITIKGVFHHRPYYVEKALDVLARKEINPLPVITDEMPLSELPAALKRMMEKKSSKIAVKP
jgi:L-iditol 2-dehydrogenase